MKAKLKNNHLLLTIIFFCALAALMFWPTGVQAADSVVPADAIEITMTNGADQKIEDSGTYHIKTDGTIQGIIRIKENAKPTIYLDNAEIDNSNGNAIFMDDNTELTLYLIGQNTLKGGRRHPNAYDDAVDFRSGGAAGIRVPASAVLTIDGEADASLDIWGGNANPCTWGSGGGAAIGTNGSYLSGVDETASVASGAVNIRGGSITAAGGMHTEHGGDGAGIGGGGGSGNRNDPVYISGNNCGAVNISGGSVVSVGSGNAADIGCGSGQMDTAGTGGSSGTASKITVSGGTVKANEIGANYTTPNAEVEITGGSVQAGTVSNTPTNGTDQVSLVTLTVEGVRDVQPIDHLAAGTYTGAAAPDSTSQVYGIHDMQTDSDGNLYLYLPDDAIVPAHNAAELRFKETQTWYSGTVDTAARSATLTALNEEIDLSTAGGNLYIWNDAYGIGSSSDTVAKKPHGGNYTLTGQNADGTGIANTVTVMADYNGNDTDGSVKKTITLNTLNIDVSSQDNTSAFDIQATASVNLMLAGPNTLKSGGDHAGLNVLEGAVLSIGSNDPAGSLTATGGTEGAGIGGGTHKAGGTISISGGIVKATGGAGGAGIGGGLAEDGGTIDISGGTVTANGYARGAGIGGGDSGSGGIISISGGTVTANGDMSGAGIGGGVSGSGGIIDISGGTVTATGGNAGAGIGGGAVDGFGGIISISGGTVWAIGGATTTDYGEDVPFSGAGIGGGHGGAGGTVAIKGGSVKAVGGEGADDIGGGLYSTEHGTLKNGSDQNAQNVYLNTLTVGENAVTEGTTITGTVDPITLTNGYGVKDVVTMDTDKLYFYLPATTADSNPPIELKAGTDIIYSRNYPRAAEQSYTAILLPPAQYTITIPENVSFDNPTYKPANTSENDRCIDKTFTVTPSGLTNLTDGRSLSVTVAGSGLDNAFSMIADGGAGLPYTVYKDSVNDQQINPGGVLATGWVNNTTAAQSGALRLDQSQIQYSGNYQGTLTFTVNINDSK